MNFKKYHVSTNLFDYTEMAYGITDAFLQSNGDVNTDIRSSKDWVITDYIPCNGTAFTLNPIFGMLTAMCLYDENKNYITGVAYYRRQIGDVTITSTVTAKYIRFSWLDLPESENYVNPATIMLNAGTTPLTYEAYYTPYWSDAPCYIHKTSTDTLTTLPADIYADGTNATVGLKGNMQQSGTPTPQNPIQPSECGDMTANLWDGIIGIDNVIINQNGSPISNNAYALSEYIPVEPNTSYIYHFYHNIAENRSTYSIVEYDSNKNVMLPLTLQWITENRDYNISFITRANTAYIRINWKKAPDEDLMLVEGSTALPYEPYGYKIPISSANTTTPVYLGEVETTRQIKKLVLTGEEDWFLSTAQTGRFGFSLSNYLKSDGTITSYCSHYTAIAQKSGGTAPNNSQYFYSGSDSARYLFIVDTSCSTAADFKAYLAAQYANGTPVTVWYVLATPTTGIVNEPLMKIGSYADSLTTSIPTVDGADSFDVLTTLKPSEVELTYTGWHDASVKEWDGSDWD